MRNRILGILPILAMAASLSCTLPPSPSSQRQKQADAQPVKITQFYAAQPKLVPGEQAQLCYGVENATYVWMMPPRQELSPALTRCVTVAPSKTTTYRLTAEGSDGKSAVQEVTVVVGSPRAHITEVRVNTLDIKAGSPVTLCYAVSNTVSVTIAPIGFKGDNAAYRCTIDKPKQTVTYVVTATGADGETDTEKVTVKVH